MAKTGISDLSNHVQKFWSPMFVDELKEETLLPSLVNRDYEGQIKGASGGDTVYVQQFNRPTAERNTTTGAGGDTFNPSLLSTVRVAVTCDQRITASFEFDDVVELQTQLAKEEATGEMGPIKKGLIEAVEIELNNYLYTKVAPSASAPDHTITGVTDFNAAQLGAVRVLAAQAKWRKMGGWYGLLDPQYYQDMLNASTFGDAQYGAADAPLIGGQFALKRMGFNILEDNSAGLVTLSGSSADAGLFFHPDFMALCMQTDPQFKVSDLHSNKQFGYVISCSFIAGAALMPDGDNKHITVINS